MTKYAFALSDVNCLIGFSPKQLVTEFYRSFYCFLFLFYCVNCKRCVEMSNNANRELNTVDATLVIVNNSCCRGVTGRGGSSVT